MKLSAATFVAHDVDALAGFYGAALGLAETVDDSPRYRELDGGGARIGFASTAAYELLGLQDDADVSGLRSFLTFEVPEAGMEDAVAQAVGQGAALVKAPYRTHFGALLAVLRDPEGNAFRLVGGTA